MKMKQEVDADVYTSRERGRHQDQDHLEALEGKTHKKGHSGSSDSWGTLARSVKIKCLD